MVNIEAFPAEVLLEIFRCNVVNLDLRWGSSMEFYYEDSRLRERRSESYVDPTLPTRVVSHVCRYWRATVLSSPQIWGRLIDCDILPGPWFEEVLRRARGTPLTVVCGRCTYREDFQDIGFERSNHNLEHLLLSGAEFKEFHGHMNIELRHSLVDSLIDRLKQPMPHLVAFSFNSASSEYLASHFWPTHSPNTLYDFELFGGKTPPLLREFSHGPPPVSLKASYLFWATLTSLSLEWLPTDFPLLSVLSQIPQLQQLIIGFNLWDSDAEWNESPTFVPAFKMNSSHLTHVRLHGPYEAITLLLNSMDSTPNLMVLKCQSVDIPRLYLKPGFSCPFSGVLAPTTFKKQPSEGKLKVQLLSNSASLTEITTPQGHHFYSEFSHDDCFMPGADWVTTQQTMLMFGCFRALFPICIQLEIGYEYVRHPPLERTVQVSGESPEPGCLFLELLLLLDHAEVVSFKGITFEKAFELLNTDGILPSLIEVRLTCTKYGPLQIDTFDKVDKFLKKRRRCGRPLRTVIIQSLKGQEDSHRKVYRKQARKIQERFGVDVIFEPGVELEDGSDDNSGI